MACCPIKGTPPKDEYFNSLSVKNAYICNLCVGNIRELRSALQLDTSIGASVYSRTVSISVPLLTYAAPLTAYPIPFDGIDFDTSNMYDVSTSRFTVPSAGLYNLNMVLCWVTEPFPIQWQFEAGMQLYRNGSPYLFVNKIAVVPNILVPIIIFSGSSSITIYLEQGDEIEPISDVFDVSGGGNIANVFMIGTIPAVPPQTFSDTRVSMASVHKVQ